LSRLLGWLIRWILDWTIGFIDTLYIPLRTTGNYSAIAILHALGFSVLTSRILATDLSQSHCNFKSRIKCSLLRLIPFLPSLLNHVRLPSSELDPIPFRLLFRTPCNSASTTLHGPHGRYRLLLSRMRIYWSVTQQWTSYFSASLFLWECDYRPVA
jgi:hypothetical protein